MAGDLFLSAIKKITEQNITIVEAIEAADALKAAGQPDLAVQVYRIWASFNQTHPLLCAAYFNLGTLLTERGDWVAAREPLERAVAANGDFYPAHINLGSIYERLGDPDRAVAQWNDLATRLAGITGPNIGFKTAALKQIGRVLEGNHHPDQAEVILQQCLTVDPRQVDVAQHFISLRLYQCKWPVVVPWEGVDRRALMAGMSPLSMAAYTDDPMLQLASSYTYNKTWDPPAGYELPRHKAGGKRNGRLRIGYVSSDLRTHAVGFLMAEVFELHDRSKVEVFAYYCGIPTEDYQNVRIKGAVEHWVDITGMDDATAARRIAEDKIDILVDVNGYTRDARTAVFARRPAPVQVNWLGFPGSMGSPYHHYILADEFIIPEESEIFYSEKVLRLPCYQPNDRKRAVAPTPTRADVGLPENAVVYCCFNGTHKISRFHFERWMQILARVPNSVLWLLEGSEAGSQRLRERAAQFGIAPERLIFAPKLANAYHLARYRLADLFLDTLPYGAHTTASDALWVGVPILTLAGRGFASRVCGSLARSAGLPELICSTPEEYVEKAVALGHNRAELARYRDQLEKHRETCVLFDMEKHVSQLEALYAQMWDEFQQGRLPRPDLSNLDVYLEARR
ncbi:MAG: O-linked N-acetylglucosamine transferase [Magnetospirillum sp.]|nr:O-linked N-acetylglucosamine transferase [Magnetospirillum sp.]